MSLTTERPDTTNGIRPIVVVVYALMLLAVVGALVVAVVHHPPGGASSSSSSGNHRVWEYTVPFGTGQRLDAGEDYVIFPAKLAVHVGDRLLVHNDDNRSQQIGPYLVDRGETMEQTFTEPGVITGLCTIHPSGRVEIDVSR